MASCSMYRKAAAVGAAALFLAASIDSGGAKPQQGGRGPLVDRATWLVRAVEAQLGSRATALGSARVGIAVRDLATGKLVYARDADGAYNLASNTKIITAAAALAALGPAFTWRTGIYVASFDPTTGKVPGNVFVRGGGNPGLDTGDLDRLAADMARAGIRQVRGRLIIDSSYFDGDDSPPHFDEQPDEQAYFR